MTCKLITTLALSVIGLACVAHAQEREWLLDVDKEDAFLVFGVPQSDDVGVSFWCKIGGMDVRMFAPLLGPLPEEETTMPITVSIASHIHVLEGKVAINKEAKTATIEAEIPAPHQMLKDLQQADRFTFDTNGHTTTLPLIDADVNGLLGLCNQRSG